MYKQEGKPNIYLVTRFTDFRCGINSLCYKLHEISNISLTSNSMFIFMNKSKDQVKILYWGGSGFWLLTYRPDKGKFNWIKEKGITNITFKQLEWLLDGLNISQKNYIEKCEKDMAF